MRRLGRGSPGAYRFGRLRIILASGRRSGENISLFFVWKRLSQAPGAVNPLVSEVNKNAAAYHKRNECDDNAGRNDWYPYIVMLGRGIRRRRGLRGRKEVR